MRQSFLNRIFGASAAGSPDRQAFIIALILLASGFLIVGSGRDDLVSLLLWRPLSALLLCLAVVTCGAEAWHRGRALFLFALAVALLTALRLVPLPPAIWTALPGSEVIVSVYRSAGMELPWQPLTVAQARTWNALFSLMGPSAVLVDVLVLDMQRHRQLLLLLIGIGFLSGIIGMIQAIGP